MRQKHAPREQYTIKHTYEPSYLARDYVEAAYAQVFPHYLHSTAPRRVSPPEQSRDKPVSRERKVG